MIALFLFMTICGLAFIGCLIAIRVYLNFAMKQFSKKERFVGVLTLMCVGWLGWTAHRLIIGIQLSIDCLNNLQGCMP